MEHVVDRHEIMFRVRISPLNLVRSFSSSGWRTSCIDFIVAALLAHPVERSVGVMSDVSPFLHQTKKVI